MVLHTGHKPPGTKYSDVYKAKTNNEIHNIVDYAENITRDDNKPSGFILGMLKEGIVGLHGGAHKQCFGAVVPNL